MKRMGLLLAVPVLLAGCASWWSDSNVEPPAELKAFSASAQVKKLWSSDTGSGPDDKFIKLTPSLQGERLYVSDMQGKVRAYAAETGKRIWQTKLKQAVTTGVAVEAGMVFLGTKDGHVLALNEDNGKPLWDTRVSSEILAPPAVDSGIVVVQTVDSKLIGLSAASGEQLWQQERSEPVLTLRGTSSPRIVGPIVLAGFANGKLAAFELKGGRFIWEIPVAEPHGRSEIERLVDIDVAPLVVGRSLYAAAYQGRVVAINLENGRILWAREISTYAGMDVDSNNLYVSDDQGFVQALDLNTGATVWKQDQLHGRRLNAPSALGNAIAVADFEGYVHWLSPDDGHFIARHRVARSTVLSQAVVGPDSTLYVNTQNGKLVALRLRPKS